MGRLESTISVLNNGDTLDFNQSVGNLLYEDKWTDLPHQTKFMKWQMENVDPDKFDGAVIEIQPGGRTPVQYVQKDITFWEVPVQGKVTALLVNPNGQFEMHHIDPANDNPNSMIEVKQGTTMCFLSHRNQPGPVVIYECEMPAFTDDCLVTVPDNSPEFDGHHIPNVFWTMVNSRR